MADTSCGLELGAVQHNTPGFFLARAQGLAEKTLAIGGGAFAAIVRAYKSAAVVVMLA
jgi:hypothetical protein